MGRTARTPDVMTATASYKCPCGYEFVQQDTPNFTKLKLISRLHSKKCEVARERDRGKTYTFNKFTYSNSNTLTNKIDMPTPKYFGERINNP